MFGKNLRRIREAAGLNQEQLAAALHKRQSTISNMESGKAGLPKATTLRALARVLHKPMEDFLVDVPDADVARPKEETRAASPARATFSRAKGAPGESRRVKGGG